MSETVLVVDDISTNRKILQQILQIKGYTVIEADSGQGAIDSFTQSGPDIILMDINMPEMDGREAAHHIKGLEHTIYTPIIYVTALSEETELVTALASGGDDYVTKPVNIEILVSKIKAHLRIRELSLQLENKNKELAVHNVRLEYEQQLVEMFFDRALAQNYLDPIYIQHYMASMSEFNGDILLAEKAPNGDIFVIVGDFTGHGLTAAMGTLPATQVFFNTVREGKSLSELVSRINRELEVLLPPQLFLAANVMQIAKNGSSLSLWASGMPNVIWLGVNGEIKQDIAANHTPLGVLKDADFDDAYTTFDTEIGDKFYFCSDGITEMSDSNGKMFGNSGLQQSLIEHDTDRITHLLATLKQYGGKAGQDDDITIAEITCVDHAEKDQA